MGQVQITIIAELILSQLMQARKQVLYSPTPLYLAYYFKP